jgi:predicted enzyme related to lactoylglutathione lyase
MAMSRFTWYELLPSDPEAAKRFYGGVIGWGTAPVGDAGYEMWINGDLPLGGVMRQPPAMPGRAAWFGYVKVSDVETTAAQVVAAGGSVDVPPTDIPGAGRFALLLDPQGAAFAIRRRHRQGRGRGRQRLPGSDRGPGRGSHRPMPRPAGSHVRPPPVHRRLIALPPSR